MTEKEERVCSREEEEEVEGGIPPAYGIVEDRSRRRNKLDSPPPPPPPPVPANCGAAATTSVELLNLFKLFALEPPLDKDEVVRRGMRLTRPSKCSSSSAVRDMI